MNGKTRAYISGVASAGMMVAAGASFYKMIESGKEARVLTDRITGISDTIRERTSGQIEDSSVGIHIGFECDTHSHALTEAECRKLEENIAQAAIHQLQSNEGKIVAARIAEDPEIQRLADEVDWAKTSWGIFGGASQLLGCGAFVTSVPLLRYRRRRREMLDKLSEFSSALQEFIRGLPEWKSGYENGEWSEDIEDLVKFGRWFVWPYYENMSEEFRQAISLFLKGQSDKEQKFSTRTVINGYYHVWAQYNKLTPERQERTHETELWNAIMSGKKLVTQYDFHELGKLFLD